MTKLLINQIQSRFIDEFNTKPLMVFSPGRINIIGEHTDYNNGYVFPAAIDKGIVTAIQKSNSEKSTAIALDYNDHFNFSLNNIQSLQQRTWRNYILGIVAEIQKSGKKISPFNLIFGGNIPIGAGLSSSAALENSLVFGLNELFELNFTKEEMIFISQNAEHNFVGVKCGIMDQYASMFGAKDTAILLDCENLKAKTVTLGLEEFSLLLINTNVKHSLAESAYNKRRSTCEKIALKLNVLSLRQSTIKHLDSIKNDITEDEYQKALYVFQENQRVVKAYEAIKQNDIKKLGELIYASHKGLKEQYKVSCKELDYLVDFAKYSEAIVGAKMIGGGFGGCTLNIVKTNLLEDVKNKIAHHYNQTFNTNCIFYQVNLSEGTKII